MPTPEQKARVQIDRQLEAAGWIVQDYKAMNIHAGPGVAIREFPLTTGHADYMLYADAKAIGTVEAKPEGHSLLGVAEQSAKYHIGLPAGIPSHRKHPNTEPASILLERILAERRKKWEANQLAKFAAAGKQPPKNWRDKYQEPAAPDTSDLPPLPKGWCWATIDQISECLDHRRVPVNKEERARRRGTIPYYGANGPVGWIDDFLFNEPLVLVVEDETFIGRTAPFSYKITGKAWVNNHAHILRATSATLIDFLNYSLMFYPFIPLTTGTTGRRKLTKKKLMEAPFALPPLEEQRQVVADVDQRLSMVESSDAIFGANLLRAARLRQSILKRAFEGKLVPQDPNDEPASVLLARISGAESTSSNDGPAQGRPARSRGRPPKNTGGT